MRCMRREMYKHSPETICTADRASRDVNLTRQQRSAADNVLTVESTAFRTVRSIGSNRRRLAQQRHDD
jgi:hypothetical protein